MKHRYHTKPSNSNAQTLEINTHIIKWIYMKIYASSNTNKPSVGFLIQQSKPPRYHSGRVLALSAGGPGLNP